MQLATVAAGSFQVLYSCDGVQEVEVSRKCTLRYSTPHRYCPPLYRKVLQQHSCNCSVHKLNGAYFADRIEGGILCVAFQVITLPR